MNTREKIAALRRLMEKNRLTAYLVPSTDPHQSEYVPECWRRRPWLSGFTGSAGDVLVTRKEAGLWTDGRYFLQAEEELRGSGIQLYKMGEPDVPTIQEYLARTLKKGDVLGADPQVLSLDRARKLERTLQAAGAALALSVENLVDLLWTDQPPVPAAPIRIQEEKYAGESVRSKLTRLREAMREKKVLAHVLTVLDSIAWLYNIRGRDASYNPVAVAYALVTPKKAFLFIAPAKVPPETARRLGGSVEIRPYHELAGALREMGKRRQRVWIDGETASRWVADLLQGADLVTEASPVVLQKARKNPVEIEGMRQAHVRDGAAMVRFLRWLENEVGKDGLTEISAAEKLEEFRALGDLFQAPSFETISGYGGHGAIVHYRVTEQTDVRLRALGIYLVDSGGQYLDGTTDVTRTVLMGGRATREQKDRFTRVLKGHIALARVRFPKGVRGIRLDTLARLPLWEVGLDYHHGTGHGVGSHLNVHEGPQSISWSRDTGAALEPGNILSNEPGYYQTGDYGFRIENLVLVVDAPRPSKNAPPSLGFETLTLVPIDTRLVEPKLLTPEETKWLNDYHRQVEKTLSPMLDGADRRWLKKACAAI